MRCAVGQAIARKERHMERPDLNGLIAAIVTPMRSDRSIDEESLRRYVDWLVGQGIRGLAVNVDTGEGPHLFPEERLRVLQIVVEEVSGRALVVAGLAASFTEQARRLAADTARAGADALLVFPISAYQGEPLDPEIPALYHHAVAEASGLPLIAFQLQPALGGVNFSAETIERIMAVDGVVAIKEASFDAKRFVETARLVNSLPSRPTVLNGNDNFLLEAYLLGAQGALLGFGTLATREQVQMHQAVRDHDLPRAFELRDRLQPLCDVIFARPVRDYRARTKHALVRLGVIDEAHVRPPLRALSKEARDLVDGALKEGGFL
jgi:4-hydroxy-tetrahydrodipicolinate synthase